MNFLSRHSSRGHSGEMKDLAARYNIEIWLEHLPIQNDAELDAFWEKVRELMDRPSSRRKLPDAVMTVVRRIQRAMFSQNPPE